MAMLAMSWDAAPIAGWAQSDEVPVACNYLPPF
jgi:hypothetical protein